MLDAGAAAFGLAAGDFEVRFRGVGIYVTLDVGPRVFTPEPLSIACSALPSDGDAVRRGQGADADAP
jgi:hypothetical protein